MKLFETMGFNIPVDAIEVNEKRTVDSKTFRLSNNKFKLIQASGPMHYTPKGGGLLRSIDLTPIDMGTYWLIDKAQYTLKIQKSNCEVEYTSNSGSVSRVTLTKLGGAPLNTLQLNVNPIIGDDQNIYFNNILPDLDIYLDVRPNKVEWFKVLHTADAVSDFEWDVEEDEFASFEMRNTTVGWDKKKNNIRASNNITYKPDRLDDVGGGQTKNVKRYTVQESYLHQVSVIIDKKTRQKEWSDDVQYPVLIDVPDITEGITTGSDDVESRSWGAASSYKFYTNYSSLYVGNSFNAISNRAGMRFQTINIPKSVTIDQADLIFTVINNFSGMTPSIYADDVDDAAAFSSNNAPRHITKTTASSTVTSGTGTKTNNVTSIVQELVDRAGWSANNDMRFVVSDTVTGTNSMQLSAYEGSGGATLEITYTIPPPAVIQFANDESDTSSVTISSADGWGTPESGNVIILSVSTLNVDTPTPIEPTITYPAGFTEIDSVYQSLDLGGDIFYSYKTGVAYKVSNGSETTLTTSFNGANPLAISVVAQEVANLDTSDLIEATDTSTNTNSTTITLGDITPAGLNYKWYLASAGGLLQNSGDGIASWSNSFTVIDENPTILNVPVIGTSYKLVPDNTATGTTATFDSNSNIANSVLVAFNTNLESPTDEIIDVDLQTVSAITQDVTINAVEHIPLDLQSVAVTNQDVNVKDDDIVPIDLQTIAVTEQAPEVNAVENIPLDLQTVSSTVNEVFINAREVLPTDLQTVTSSFNSIKINESIIPELLDVTVTTNDPEIDVVLHIPTLDVGVDTATFEVNIIESFILPLMTVDVTTQDPAIQEGFLVDVELGTVNVTTQDPVLDEVFNVETASVDVQTQVPNIHETFLTDLLQVQTITQDARIVVDIPVELQTVTVQSFDVNINESIIPELLTVQSAVNDVNTKADNTVQIDIQSVDVISDEVIINAEINVGIDTLSVSATVEDVNHKADDTIAIDTVSIDVVLNDSTENESTILQIDLGEVSTVTNDPVLNEIFEVETSAVNVQTNDLVLDEIFNVDTSAVEVQTNDAISNAKDNIEIDVSEVNANTLLVNIHLNQNVFIDLQDVTCTLINPSLREAYTNFVVEIYREGFEEVQDGVLQFTSALTDTMSVSPTALDTGMSSSTENVIILDTNENIIVLNNSTENIIIIRN